LLAFTQISFEQINDLNVKLSETISIKEGLEFYKDQIEGRITKLSEEIKIA
jgi:hypothetical protein